MEAEKAVRPLPVATDISRPYWQAAREHKLSFQRCTSDGIVFFYPRVVCPSCAGTSLEWIESSGRGSIYSFTVVHRAPSEAFKSKVPYVVAIVETDEGVRMMTNIRIDDPAKVSIGDRVRVVFDDVSGTMTIPEFALDKA